MQQSASLAMTAAPRRRRRPDPYGQRAEIERYVAGLPADAPLRVVMAQPSVERAIATYDASNDDAIRSQARYKRIGRLALILTAAGMLAAAATLLPISAWFPVSAVRIVSGLQSSANIIALGLVWWINRHGVIDTWMAERAKAESLRGDIFRAVLMQPGPLSAASGQLERQKLDLISAAHIDYQLGYFRSAVRKHQAAAGHISLPRVLATLATLGAVAVGGAVFIGFSPRGLPRVIADLMFGDPIRWQLGLNTIASSLLAYTSARTAMNQDERNAALYANSLRRLDELKETQKKATEAAADRGDGARVEVYLAEAQAILDADHMAWRLARPPANPTIGPSNRL